MGAIKDAGQLIMLMWWCIWIDLTPLFNPGLVMSSLIDLPPHQPFRIGEIIVESFCLQGSYWSSDQGLTIEADYLWQLQVFNLLPLLTDHPVCLPQGWLCSMLRDDRPLQQQNVCREGDSTEQGVQTTPEGQGMPLCLFTPQRLHCGLGLT